MSGDNNNGPLLLELQRALQVSARICRKKHTEIMNMHFEINFRLMRQAIESNNTFHASVSIEHTTTPNRHSYHLFSRSFIRTHCTAAARLDLLYGLLFFFFFPLVGLLAELLPFGEAFGPRPRIIPYET